MTAPLVLSLGDPTGIGPEIVSEAWAALRTESNLAFCLVGDAAYMSAHVPVTRISHMSEVEAVFAESLPVWDRPLSAPVVTGQADTRHAPHIIGWIEEAVALCQTQQARGLITAPIAKAVLYEAGFRFPGHTEFLADLCAIDDIVPTPVMMLSAQDLRVVLATIHTPLKSVSDALSTSGLIELCRITEAALKRDFGMAAPRMAVAGLNPHAGEDGSIGREEQDIIAPAIAHLKAEGMSISGPFPADTMFHEEARKTYDAAVCMYHDQGLIPLKTLDFWGGVNTTLGLPIVRTSPDHGTGFSIAGKGVARPDSLIAAIRMADQISRNRNR